MSPGSLVSPTATVAELLAHVRSDPDWTTRVAAVTALAGKRDVKVQPALEAALGDAQLEVRVAVAGALGARGDVHAVSPLATAITTEIRTAPDDAFVVAAANAVGALRGASAVAALVGVLGASAGAGRDAALEALQAIGLPTVAPLTSLLSNKDSDVRLAAVDGLYAPGKPGVKPLIGALKNSDAKVRSRAANRLGYLKDTSAEAGLVALLDGSGYKTPSIALARIFQATPTKLVRYLASTKTIHVYFGLVYVGAAETAPALASALLKRGDYEMAVFFLNCGNDTLEEAAHDWAYANGYYVTSIPGSSGGTWGSGLPE